MQQILKTFITTNFPDSIKTKPMSNHSNNPSSSNFLLWRFFAGRNWAILDVQDLMRWPTDMRIVGIYQQFSDLCEREVHSYIPLRFPLVQCPGPSYCPFCLY